LDSVFNLYDKNTILKKVPLQLTKYLITVKAISDKLTLIYYKFRAAVTFG